MTREAVIAGLAAACAQILVANGYNTNAGQRVFRYPVGIDSLQDGDFPCIVAADAFQEDSISPTSEAVDNVSLMFEVFALAREAESWRNGTMPTRLNNLRADLKKALTTRAVFGTNAGDLKRLGAVPVYDEKHNTGFVGMRILLAYSEA